MMSDESQPPAGAVAPQVRAARWLALGLIGAGVVLVAAISWNRAFQVDEVEHLHAGYHVASGRFPYVDFWQLHDPLLYALLGPLTDPDDPLASYRRGRALMLLFLLGTAGAVAVAAGRLAGPPAAALAGGLLLLHTTFAERAIEVRPDGVAAFLVAVALALQLDERADRRLLAVVGSGVLLGSALLATKKAVFVVLLFVARWLVRAWRGRSLAPLLPALGAAAVLFVAVASMLILGIFGAYLRATWLTSLDAMGGSEAWISFPPTHVLVRESLRNLPFVALAGLGWLCGLVLSRRGSDRDRRLLFPALLAAGAFGALWLQPFPWPYVHLAMLPALAVIASAGTLRLVARGGGRWAARQWPLVAGLLLVAAASASPRLLRQASPDPGPKSQARQLALLAEVQHATRAEDPVFDMAGLYFRPDAYPAYALSSDLLRVVRSGGLPPLAEELRARGVVALVVSYRVDWLQGEEREFFADRFVHHTDNLFVLGADLTGAPTGTDLPWEALAERGFRWEGPAGGLWVDGQPFERGTLARGLHTLRLREGVTTGRLVLETPPLRDEWRPSQPLYIQFDE